MIDFENTIVIARPVEEVFNFIADFENVPKWNYYVSKVTRTSGTSMNEGTTYHQVRRSDQQDFQVVDYTPHRSVAIKTLPGSSPQFEMTFTFEPSGGNTRLVDSWKLQTGHNRLVERLGAAKVKSAVAENLSRLKELLETGETRLQDGRIVRI